jgi:single-strand DNA-binding protein
MAGLNKVILIGRIGKDPETFQFEDGTKKISFSLATTESYRDRSTNEWKDVTEWHNIVGYRYMADRNVAKGDLVFIEGKIKSRKYTDRDGNERYITEIVAEKLNMLSRYQQQEGYQRTEQQETYTAENTASPTDISNEGPAEDDLPF